MIGSGSAISTSTMSLINPSLGIVFTSLTALLTSLAILITNENFSKLKLRYTKLRGWISFITNLYEKTLNQSMIDKKKLKKKPQNSRKFIIIILIREKKL